MTTLSNIRAERTTTGGRSCSLLAGTFSRISQAIDFIELIKKSKNGMQPAISLALKA
ncbi:hypothetical protein K5D38_03235 [Pseudomonas cichorii]|uniref:hypothetical protein n=1 Tax=Pseudomonas capsici TaxID=2810614 RepID=UPI0013C33627|nr:hypothetical protein [Pseudomonas capsici]MBX8473785.1 hypothetical protein [Pseudomonas cichorii]MBX8607656.1 hypothetical protein [Pseudomonas cichorii]MCV4261815.1 hypothetical protein [Pseudomonas capsici]